MKKILFIVFLFSSFVTGLSQSTDQKIAEFLGGQRVLEFQRQNNPGYIKFLETRLNHGFILTEFNEARHVGYQNLSNLNKKEGTEIVQESIETFIEKYHNGSLNILFYVFPENGEHDLIFKLGNTNYVLIIYSAAHINSLVKKL